MSDEDRAAAFADAALNATGRGPTSETEMHSDMDREITRVALFDRSGRPSGHADIPTDVIQAAARVHHWLRGQPEGTKLHGLRLDGKN